MSTLSLVDKRYEKEICRRLLEVSRYMYATEPSLGVIPSNQEVIREHEDATVEDIREKIEDNIRFIRTTYKYMLFDREAIARENK